MKNQGTPQTHSMSLGGDCQGSFPSRESPGQRQRCRSKSPVRYVPNRLVDQSLGHDIRVRYPSKYKDSGHIAEMKTYTIKQDEQASLTTAYDSLGLKKCETLLTDIYEICGSSDRNIRPFQFSPGDKDDVTLRLSLKGINPIQDHQKYTAHIKVDGLWSRTPASYQSGMVTFNAFQIDTFCVSCTPFSEKFEVTPSGGHFKSKHNPDVEIYFPDNAVKKTEKINIQILPIDLSRVYDSYEENDDIRNILAISDCVEVSHSKDFTLLAPVRLSLHLKVNKEKWTDQYKLVDLHLKDGEEINIEPTEPLHCDFKIVPKGYNITFDVSRFTGRQLALVHRRTNPQIIKTAAKVAIGIQIRCKILVFTSAMCNRSRTMWFECVQLKRIKEKVEACEQLGFAELPKCRSTEFSISEGERILVEISGSGRVQREVSKEHTYIPFIGAMSDNYLSIPIDIKKGLGQSVFVQLKFTLMSSIRRHVHAAHFDPLLADKRPRRKRSKSPYRPRDKNGNFLLGNERKSDVRKRSQTNYEEEEGNPVREHRRPSVQDCPQIAVREPTVLTMSSGSGHHTITGSTQSAYQATTGATTPNSSRATSPGAHAMSASGISRQSSLEVFLNSFDTDDSFSIGRATPKFGNAAFGGKSLHRLAKKIPPSKTLELAIQLDLDETEVEHILHQYRDNIVTANFKILMGWLGIEKGSADGAFQTLCVALEEIGHNSIKNEFEIAYKEGRPLQ